MGIRPPSGSPPRFNVILTTCALLSATLPMAASAFTLNLHNNRPDSENMYVMLTGSDITGLTGIGIGVSTKWSDLTQGNVASISMDTIVGGRLYVALGPMPPAPVPDQSQYYGWIELTKTSTDPVVWINLSNVDIVGLPLSLAGTRSTGGPFSLGYRSSTLDIVSQLEGILVNPDAPAKIICDFGQTKIVAPNIMPSSYKSYDPYLQSLTEANARIVIVSDTPPGEAPVTFTGNFRQVSNDDEAIISMAGSNGKTFEILKGQLTTTILYRCDGGTLIYDGITYDQNRVPGTSASEIITNSVFRNICIGFNEGYFTPSGENDSSKFTSGPPFKDGMGSQYARIIHENSNSYGFPYADSNLKTLETASPSEPIELNILREDQIG